jgi:hypothetical protein
MEILSIWRSDAAAKELKLDKVCHLFESVNSNFRYVLLLIILREEIKSGAPYP